MKKAQIRLGQALLLLALGSVFLAGCQKPFNAPMLPATPIPVFPTPTPVFPTPIPCIPVAPIDEGPVLCGSYFGSQIQVFKSLAELAAWGLNWEVEPQFLALDFTSKMLVVYGGMYASGCGGVYPPKEIRLGQACYFANQINLNVDLVYDISLAPNPSNGPPNFSPPPVCESPTGPCYPCDPVIDCMYSAGTLPISSIPIIVTLGYIYE